MFVQNMIAVLCSSLLVFNSCHYYCIICIIWFTFMQLSTSMVNMHPNLCVRAKPDIYTSSISLIGSDAYIVATWAIFTHILWHTLACKEHARNVTGTAVKNCYYVFLFVHICSKESARSLTHRFTAASLKSCVVLAISKNSNCWKLYP